MFVRPRTALAAALACIAGLVVTGVLAYLVPVARDGDAGALNGYVGLASDRSDVLHRITHFADPVPYGFFGICLIVVAVVRGRLRLAAVLPLVLLMAPVTTESLKHLLAHPREAEWLGQSQIAAASWPSGHATASMTLALCGVLVAPQLLRPFAAVAGGLYSLAISFAMLMAHGHFPSDIVGGYLCAGTWVLLGVAALRGWEGSTAGVRFQLVTVAEALPAVGLAATAFAIVAAAALERPRTLLRYVAERPSFAVSVIVIATLAALLAGLLARIAREPMSR